MTATCGLFRMRGMTRGEFPSPRLTKTDAPLSE
jgi:hypothetical protein